MASKIPKKRPRMTIPEEKVKCQYCQWWKRSTMDKGRGLCLSGGKNHGNVTGFLDGNGCPEFILTEDSPDMPLHCIEN